MRSKNRAVNKTSRVEIRLTKSQKQTIREFSKAHKMSVSKYILFKSIPGSIVPELLVWVNTTDRNKVTQKKEGCQN